MRDDCCTWKTPQERAQFKRRLSVSAWIVACCLQYLQLSAEVYSNSQSPASSQRTAVTYGHMDDVKPIDRGFYSLLFLKGGLIFFTSITLIAE